MGHSLLESTRRTMIRIVIVVCCAALAAAEAEADPAVFYRSYAHHGLYQPGYTAGYTAGYPSAVRTYASPLTTSYTTGYHGYQAAPATVGSYQPYGYAASGRYPANSVGAVHIAKREAEAEPEAEAEAEADPALIYNSFGHHALYNTAFNTAFNPAYNTYSYPSVYSRSYYQPSYNTFGLRSFYGKREAEAEAEADPAVVYGHNGLYNTVYNTAYTTGFPALRAYSAPVHHGYSLGYRNLIQPSYYRGHYY